MLPRIVMVCVTGASSHAMLSQVMPSQAKPCQAKLSHAKPCQAMSSQARPSQAGLSQAKLLGAPGRSLVPLALDDPWTGHPWTLLGVPPSFRGTQNAQSDNWVHEARMLKYLVQVPGPCPWLLVLAPGPWSLVPGVPTLSLVPGAWGP